MIKKGRKKTLRNSREMRRKDFPLPMATKNVGWEKESSNLWLKIDFEGFFTTIYNSEYSGVGISLQSLRITINSHLNQISIILY